MNKELELQNSNYSYELKSNIDLLHLQRHILFIMRPILAIFAALDMLGGGLQNLLKLWRQHSNVQKSMNVYPPFYPCCIMCYNYISTTMFIPYCAIILKFLNYLSLGALV
jgi:hypothetical protein